ncbi:hypothetical protein BAE44_0002935 [Dichanthelium oligosanthes]|uniref:Pentatricopeptide repeat-containing protein n=1 Tax=Dichanthelium oligosanthes TaxID=888268 RepID=A0A1E5WF71_9POAL|nr:hypothetical protein BAE44_0002935 [Dichanthelium oligosanthes]
MEEILAFARSLAPAAVAGDPAFAEFLAGYSHGDLSEAACVELMMRMSEEGLELGCAFLFQWLREKQQVPVSPQVWLAGIVALGRCRMPDEVLEVVARLPSEREFREAVVYNAAISAVAYCERSEEGLELGCAFLFQWLREKQQVPVPPQVLLRLGGAGCLMRLSLIHI